jgi:hypothetical protein
LCRQVVHKFHTVALAPRRGAPPQRLMIVVVCQSALWGTRHDGRKALHTGRPSGGKQRQVATSAQELWPNLGDGRLKVVDRGPDLRREHLDVGLECPNQRILLVMRQAGEVGSSVVTRVLNRCRRGHVNRFSSRKVTRCRGGFSRYESIGSGLVL